MEKTDWFGTGRRYLDHVVCERAYPIHGNGEFQCELFYMLLGTLLYPWELWRRIVPFSGIVESIEKIPYSDTKRFIISYVEIGGKLYSCLIDDEIEVGDHIKRTITGRVFVVTSEKCKQLQKGYRVIV